VFTGCTSLSTITVNASNSVYRCVDGVLFNQSQTTLVEYPVGLGGSYYTIPNSVTNLGNYAFAYCTSLTTVVIPNSVISIGSYAFYDCTSLSAITVGTNNPSYCSVDGVLFNKSKNTLIQYPAGKAAGSYSLPDSVTNIASSAFYGCANLTGITIGTNVTSIGSSAFYNCTRLTAVCFQGNAPGGGSDSSVFSGDNSATVYYLPGTTGWHSPFDSCRAFLWNPQPQTSGTSFSVRTNRFGFTIIGSSNLVIVVEACTLTNSIWVPVGTNTLNTFIGTNGTSYFSDPKWTNYSVRCYRLRSP